MVAESETVSFLRREGELWRLVEESEDKTWQREAGVAGGEVGGGGGIDGRFGGVGGSGALKRQGAPMESF